MDNPLKGLVPYVGDVRERFPHSMEFDYLPLASLVTGYDQYDWQPLEKRLDAIAGRGHQAIFRVYMEYPGKPGAIPPFLIADGLKVHRYLNTNTDPPAPVETPDYENPKLRKVLKAFVAAMGKKYDGDARIGFITAGLLGAWGEWHTYPKEELFASKTVQAEVMDAYEAAFKITPILLRYPAGEEDEQKTPNARRHFGYHDDSFAWATLDTGREVDDWFFVPALKSAGPDAMAKWKTRPIGGEIRPEAWGQVFDERPQDNRVQNFRRCVEATHATWLMDSGLFEKQQPADRIKRAEEVVRRMGYEFHVSAVTIGVIAHAKLPVRVELQNRGVAPFYYDWPVEFALIADGKVIQRFAGHGNLTGLLPDAEPRTWNETLDISGLAPRTYKLAMRVPNKLLIGRPVRFANTTQDADAPGWLTLGDVLQN